MPVRFPLAIAALLTAGSFAALPAMAQDVDFGDDSGLWASDGECDDPRFEGPGMAPATDPTGEMADSTDCMAAYSEGRIALIGQGGMDAGAPVADNSGGAVEVPEGDSIEFGGDTAVWINDGECDDPRFEGPGMSAAPVDADIMGDASDCQALYMAGMVQLAGETAPGGDSDIGAPGDVDFGDDSGAWNNDGECDDPRFQGPGMAAVPDDFSVFADATDCRTLFEAGQVALTDFMSPPEDDYSDTSGLIDFGIDMGDIARNGECDDVRFEGPGMALSLDPANWYADATDCAMLLDAGQISLIDTGMAEPTDDGAAPFGTVDFGDDTSPWINDGECDDPRFEGPGMAMGLDASNTLADASDCQALFDAGQVSLADAAMTDPVDNGGPLGGDYDFGDDTSPWINDGECDDPRFEGPGMATGLDPANTFGDATDCRALFEAGQVTMAGTVRPTKPGQTDAGQTDAGQTDAGQTDAGMDGTVDFGADSGQWTNDGECDDPRFVGQGMAEVLEDADLFADATDCKALFDAGSISLADGDNAAPAADAVDFGADSGQWTNDGECDDPRFVGDGMAEQLVDADLFADATDCRTLFDAGMISLR